MELNNSARRNNFASNECITGYIGAFGSIFMWYCWHIYIKRSGL